MLQGSQLCPISSQRMQSVRIDRFGLFPIADACVTPTTAFFACCFLVLHARQESASLKAATLAQTSFGRVVRPLREFHRAIPNLLSDGQGFGRSGASERYRPHRSKGSLEMVYRRR